MLDKKDYAKPVLSNLTVPEYVRENQITITVNFVAKQSIESKVLSLIVDTGSDISLVKSEWLLFPDNKISEEKI